MTQETTPRNTKPVAAIVMGDYARETVYAKDVRRQIEAHCRLVHVGSPQRFASAIDATTAASIEFLFSGWGCPLLDQAFLDRLPRLQAVFYAAGTVKSVVTDHFWTRAIPLCSAASANAIPVAEYAFAQIILCLKKAHRAAAATRSQGRFAWPERLGRVGSYGATVGLVSFGAIARLVRQRLQSLEVNVVAFDPFCSQETAAQLNVELVSLEQLFQRSDVVSIHAPSLPETKAMINAALLSRLPEGAALINTARGDVIDQAALVRFLRDRPDVQAVLDVTHPEPPPSDSALYTLPNVFLTPHLAGSIDRECARMGMTMVEELRRLLAGEPLRHAVDRQALARMA